MYYPRGVIYKYNFFESRGMIFTDTFYVSDLRVRDVVRLGVRPTVWSKFIIKCSAFHVGKSKPAIKLKMQLTSAR